MAPTTDRAAFQVTTAVADALSSLSAKPSRDDVVTKLREMAETFHDRSGLELEALMHETMAGLRTRGVADGEARRLVFAALRPQGESTSSAKPQGTSLAFTDAERWPEPVDGASLLDEIVAIIARHVVLPRHAAEAAALWVVTTYCLDHVRVAVRLILTSPTRECGKTRLLTVLSALVRRALPSSGMTSASLFRTIEIHAPTFLIDEADNARLNENDELRAVLNSGHTRGTAFVLRIVGDEYEPQKFSTWSAVCLAGIGGLPDTVTSRAIVLKLQRKPRGVKLASLRESRIHAELEPVRQRLTRWAADFGPKLFDADPELPGELDGRAADNAGVLVAIADIAGGVWPERARTAMAALAGAESDSGEAGEVLLADLRDLYDERQTDRLASEEIVVALSRREDRPWPEWKNGKPLTPRQLARLLKPHGIEPDSVRFDGQTLKGYKREQFEDAWARYLPPNPEQAEQSANSAADRHFPEPERNHRVPDDEPASGPRHLGSVPDVPDRAAPADGLPPNLPDHWDVVSADSRWLERAAGDAVAGQDPDEG